MTQKTSSRSAMNGLLLGVGCLIFCGLGWGLGWGLDPQNFPVRNVVMTGEFQHLSQTQLQTRVSAQLAGGVLAMNISQVRNVISTLAWVEEVEVWRQWPDTLRVTIKERQAYARWGKDELLSPQGERFLPAAAEIPEGLPHLSGPRGSERKVLAKYFRLTPLLAPYGLQANILQVSRRNAWSLILKGGPILHLGQGNSVSRLQRFMPIYKTTLHSQQNRIHMIDLRYTNGFSVRWKKTKGASSAWTTINHSLHAQSQAQRLWSRNA